MIRRDTLAAALAVLGIALLVAPALFPLQPVLYHDTDPSTTENASQLREQGYEIVHYDDLSPRGQELYVRTLREGGRYFVPKGQGANDFAYPPLRELDDHEDYREERLRRTVIIERPPNATDLPPADERFFAAERFAEDEERRGSDRSEAEIRRRIARYDMMTTRTDSPPQTAPTALVRLLSAVLGVLAVGAGGYLRAKP